MIKSLLPQKNLFTYVYSLFIKNRLLKTTNYIFVCEGKNNNV